MGFLNRLRRNEGNINFRIFSLGRWLMMILLFERCSLMFLFKGGNKFNLDIWVYGVIFDSGRCVSK